MAPFPTGVSYKENASTRISPKIIIASCILAFLAIASGFLFIARKKRRAASPEPPAHTLASTAQPKHAPNCPNRREPAVPHGASDSVPTGTNTAASEASGSRCPVCASQPTVTATGTATGRRGFDVPRSSRRSIRSLPPYTRRAAPTGVLTTQVRPQAAWRASRASPHATTSSTPAAPAPAYVARGPTASLRRAG